MEYQSINDEMCEQAALFSLGALDPQMSRAFEQHLRTCAACRFEVRTFDEVSIELALDVAQKPPPELRARVLSAIQESAKPILILRSGEGRWMKTPFPGVSIKVLHQDPQSKLITQLVRLAPGAQLPSHRHVAPEQCYVVEGDVQIGADSFGPGDFSIAPAATLHSVVSSVHGCLLVIIGSPENEVVT